MKSSESESFRIVGTVVQQDEPAQGLFRIKLKLSIRNNDGEWKDVIVPFYFDKQIKYRTGATTDFVLFIMKCEKRETQFGIQDFILACHPLNPGLPLVSYEVDK